MDLIYEHSNGAKLYQCGALEIPGTPEDLYYGWDRSNLLSKKERKQINDSILKGLKTSDIDLLILAATEYHPKFEAPTLEIVSAPFPDEETEKIASILKKLNPTIDKAVALMEEGKNVLSTCWAGINRSSLISGLILEKLTRLSGKEIVELIRERRDKYCLCNETFYWALI